jgi:hypothetical protein
MAETDEGVKARLLSESRWEVEQRGIAEGAKAWAGEWVDREFTKITTPPPGRMNSIERGEMMLELIEERARRALRDLLPTIGKTVEILPSPHDIFRGPARVEAISQNAVHVNDGLRSVWMRPSRIGLRIILTPEEAASVPSKCPVHGAFQPRCFACVIVQKVKEAKK